MKKGHQNIFTSRVSFQLLLQPRLYNLLLHSQKRQTTVANTSLNGVVPKIPVFFVRGNQFEPLLTITIPLVRSYYTLSKIWIRLFFMSDTAILPSLRFAVDLGPLNSPI